IELTLDGELRVEQRDNLEIVRASADSLLTVINDILDFSKIEAGKLTLDAMAFNLRHSLEETMDTVALRAHQKGLELICEVEPQVPEWVSGDPTRLRQVIVNLLGNSIKFTEQGEVTLQVHLESLGQDTAAVHFAVRDTGIGVPAEKQKLIFGAFSQADASTTRKFGGTGLGLAISSRLVEMMGGKIWVESAIGEGSTFHFTVGLGARQSPAGPELPEPTRLGSARVLVVDDNATSRHALEENLRRWGLKPAAAEDGTNSLSQRTTVRSGDRGCSHAENGRVCLDGPNQAPSGAGQHQDGAADIGGTARGSNSLSRAGNHRVSEQAYPAVTPARGDTGRA
ncbi:MAG: hypothetical protein DMG24_13875, partial [Acidobacteria bacterium]